MYSNELSRHQGEVARNIGNNKWEQHDNGILIPSMNAVAGGQYAYRLNKGPWSEWEPNLLPIEGLILLLNLLGNHVAIPSALYIALHANTTTVLSSHNAAGYTATFGEITSGSEGYSESTRVAWASATASVTAAIHNNASPAEFTIVTATSLTVNGVAMLTASAKGATTGSIVSASKFGATRTFSNTDLFDVKYQLGLSS